MRELPVTYDDVAIRITDPGPNVTPPPRFPSTACPWISQPAS